MASWRAIVYSLFMHARMCVKACVSVCLQNIPAMRKLGAQGWVIEQPWKMQSCCWWKSEPHWCRCDADSLLSAPLQKQKTKTEDTNQKRAKKRTGQGKRGDEAFKGTLKGMLLSVSVKEWANKNISSTPIPSARKGSTWNRKNISRE